jgi:IS5 family transposase
VSLHDKDARPIAKGRLGKPVEFGYKALCRCRHNAFTAAHPVMPR